MTWKKVLSFILGAAFVLLFVVFVLGLIITRDLLSPDLYSQALSENDVYERVYTELLADPAVQESFKEMTGIEIDLLTEEAYAQVVGALYLILPPTRMQNGADAFFTNLTAYLSGDTAELPEDVNFGAAVTPEVLANRIVKAATAVAVGTIDKTVPIIVEKTEPLVQEELTTYLDNFNEGRLIPIPPRLLRASVSTFTTAANEQLVTAMLGPANATVSDQTRLQMEAALAEDDLSTAIAIAIQERLTLRVTERLAASSDRLAESQALIGISGAAMAIGETRDTVVRNLNTVRGYAMTLQNLLLPLAIVLLIILLVIGWLNNQDLRSALRAVGWTLVIAGGLMLLLWLIGGFALRSGLQSALANTVFGPAGLDGIVRDAGGSLINGIWYTLFSTALPFFLIGLLLLIIGYSEGLAAWLEDALSGVREYRWAVLGGALLLLVGLPLLFGMFGPSAREARNACNGHVELCDRPIDQVAFASSHNAMSIAEYGWIWPMHDGTITDQLDYGIRALLIDSHYIQGPDEEQEFVSTLSPKSQEVAQKAINAAVLPPQDGTFLCHQLCRLGWSDLQAGLVEVRAFLDENPREVLFLVVQDAITPEETAAVIDAAGLTPYLYTHPEGTPWPTLRQLIDSNQRLLVMAEEESPPPDWYLNAFDYTMETPYTFIFPEQFSCEPNRGGTGKPFFMLNHWIQRGSPNRVDGAIVNDYDFLLARAEQCAAERGHIPNFVAVNWFSQGDLIDVVDTLNGVYEGEQ